MPTTPPNVVLPPNWTTCERGNTWLVNDGGDHIAWFDLPGGQRLEVSVTPGNYPGFYVNVLEPEKSTDASLAKHINGKLVGWVVRKCNIPGVKLDGETIAEAGPELFIQTKSCGEYDRHGPYATEDDRVKAAASAWMGEGDFHFSQETDDIERLNVYADGREEVDSFSNGELDSDE